MTLMMRLVTSLTGRLVGRDGYWQYLLRGEEARPGPQLRRRRWVMYAGEVEASSDPARVARLAALHDRPCRCPETVRRAWQKPHEPNLTGTPLGYRPPGSDYLGGKRPPATGDYEAWTPGS